MGGLAQSEKGRPSNPMSRTSSGTRMPCSVSSRSAPIAMVSDMHRMPQSPGTGVRTASSILLGIGGDIANFKSAAHLAAHAGIAPVTGQSGTSIKGEKPSRRGNKRL